MGNAAPVPSAHDRVIRFVDADGVRLRTSVRGSGPPLLLITGLGASLDLGVPFEQELAARGVQAVSFDAPGVGESSNYRWPPRMPGIARTVEHMLDALGYDSVDALGVSLGGVVAQQLAHQAPHRVRRLILAATGPGLGGVPGSPSALLPLATPRRYYQPDYYRRVAGRIYGGAARQDPDALLHGSPARFIERPTPRGYFGQIYAITGWTSIPWLRTLPQPTLVLGGDDDPIVPLVNARILTRLIPDARLHVLRDAGHLFLLERPAETAGLVAAFLAEGPAPSYRHPPGSPPDDRSARPRGGWPAAFTSRLRRSPATACADTPGTRFAGPAPGVLMGCKSPPGSPRERNGGNDERS